MNVCFLLKLSLCQFSKKSNKVVLEKGLFCNASPDMTVIFLLLRKREIYSLLDCHDLSRQPNTFPVALSVQCSSLGPSRFLFFSQIHEKQVYNYFWKLNSTKKYAQTTPLDGVSSLLEHIFEKKLLY
jgi:hypothetical protein